MELRATVESRACLNVRIEIEMDRGTLNQDAISPAIGLNVCRHADTQENHL